MPGDQPGPEAEGGSLWRVRKADGSELGPFETAEVKERIRAGEINQNDQIALGQDAFVAIADKQVFQDALGKESKEKSAAAGKKAGKKKKKSSPRIRSASVRRHSKTPMFVGMTLLLLIGGGGFVVMSHPEWLPEMGGSEFANPLLNQINLWRLQYPDIEGTSAEHFSKGRKYYLDDSESSYLLANDELRKALLIDPDNIAAIGAYVENLSRLPDIKQRTDDVNNALKGIDYAISLAPKRASLQRARGALLLALGSVQKAQSALHMALRINPGDAETLLILAESDLNRNNSQAIARAEKAQSIDPSLARADLIIGLALQGDGQFKQAYNYFKKRLKADPGHVETMLALARLYSDLGEAKKAMTILGKIIENDDANISARLLLAKISYQARSDLRVADLQLTLATENFAQREELNPQELAALVHLVHVRGRRGDWSAAEKFAQHVLKLDASYLPAHYALGRVQEHNKQYAKAIKSYQRVLQAMQGQYQEVEVRLALGVAELEFGKYDDAASDFEQIVAENPHQVRAYLGTAAAYAKSGDSANLAMAMRKVLNIDPDYDPDHFVLSDYPVYSDDIKIFLKAIKSFVASDDVASIRLSSMAIAAYQLGDMAMTKSYITQALEADKNNFAALMYQGAMQLRMGNPAAAQSSLELARRVNRLHRVTHYLLGMSQVKLKQNAQAIKTLNSVINDDSSFLPALCAMGNIELAQGKKDQARDHFLSAFKISSDMLPAKRGLFAVGR